MIPHGGYLNKVTVLAWVRPPALARAIQWILSGSPDVRVVTHKTRGPHLSRLARQWRPRLLLVSAELLAGKEGIRILHALKRSNPRSKVILIGFTEGFAAKARKWGAHACLRTEVLVRRLKPTVRKLTAEPHKTKRRSS
jgi:DNA-binding NarL/FixJ family response regulator